MNERHVRAIAARAGLRLDRLPTADDEPQQYRLIDAHTGRPLMPDRPIGLDEALSESRMRGR